MSFTNSYRGKTVFITGHTGFKGSWLCEWLLMMGAKVVGYALEPPTAPSHFAALKLGPRLQADIRGDVRDFDALRAALDEHNPDFIFHLAAQPLVRRGFSEPHFTIETNVMGSLNVLEAVRQRGKACVVIMITTDKVYENEEWTHAYRENDALGGHDPYSASKACAEMLISSYQRSFFERHQQSPQMPTIALASVRGGNVIGGGDWAKDRIVPGQHEEPRPGQKNSRSQSQGHPPLAARIGAAQRLSASGFGNSLCSGRSQHKAAAAASARPSISAPTSPRTKRWRSWSKKSWNIGRGTGPISPSRMPDTKPENST